MYPVCTGSGLLPPGEKGRLGPAPAREGYDGGVAAKERCASLPSRVLRGASHGPAADADDKGLAAALGPPLCAAGRVLYRNSETVQLVSDLVCQVELFDAPQVCSNVDQQVYER